MKNCIKFAIAIFFMLSFTDMLAQIKPGYIFGFNLSTLTLKNKGISSYPKLSFGIHYGGFIEIPVSDNFTFQPAFLLSAKGCDYKIDTAEISISPIYIEVSVIPVYRFNIDAVKISLFAGPYLAWGVGGYKIVSGRELKSISFGSGDNHDMKSFDAGLNFGAGVNIKGLLISAQYGIGLANLSTVTTADSEMKNKVIGISFCSLFPGKK